MTAEEKKARDRERYWQHRDYHIAYQRAYYKEHTELCKARVKASQRKRKIKEIFGEV